MLGRSFRLLVDVPAGYDAAEPSPVVYVLDGGAFYPLLASNPALHRNLEFFLQPHKGCAQTRLFVSLAEGDAPRFREPALTWVSTWSARAEAPFELKVVQQPGQDHFSAVPEAFRQGINWLLVPVIN